MILKKNGKLNSSAKLDNIHDNVENKQIMKLSFVGLVWPIFVELFLRTMFGSVDTFMLSGYSEDAVTGVGGANQYVSILILIFQVVSGGSSIVISQYLGARNKKRASEVASVSIIFNLIFGLTISIIIFLFGGKILGIMNFESQVYSHAKDFLTIVGMFSFITALSTTCSAILRSHGYVKYPMYVNLGANILNIIGNLMFIYGLFGMPILGVKGVAISTVSSQAIGLVVLMAIMLKKTGVDLSIKKIVSLPAQTVREIVKDVMRIGGPSAGESLSYNISQVAITAIIASIQIGYLLTARFLVFNIISYSLLASYAIGQGSQILVGHLIGAGKMDEAYKTCLRNLRIGVFASLIGASLLAIFGVNLLGLFTNNKDILEVGGILFIITIILEPGRAFNLVLGSSLKGAGDATFTMILGLVSMWTIAVGMSYVIGVQLHMGLIGVWIAFVMDEWTRGLVMLFRWKSRAWEKKVVVTIKNEDKAEYIAEDKTDGGFKEAQEQSKNISEDIEEELLYKI